MKTEDTKALVAKDWILKLANGINPLDGNPVREDDVVNNVHISRCLFYAAELINAAITKKTKKSKVEQVPFSITAEQLALVQISDHIAISGFVREINKVIPEGMKGITNNTILNWLIQNGYIKEILTDKGVRIKRPTESGSELGISVSQKEGMYGIFTVVEYNANAQSFILDNIYAIIES